VEQSPAAHAGGATLDFPEEEIDFLKQSVPRRSASLHLDRSVFRHAAQGALLREG
jgi:tRNA modification GTPase